MMDEHIEEYYNSHVDGKLKGFTDKNERIECAWKTVIQYAPKRPTHILEVGCGIGDTCHRMAAKWKNSVVTGIDISSKSIEIAKKLFGSERVLFYKLLLDQNAFSQRFDLILLMDVYEHIKSTDRVELHLALKNLLSDTGKIILSCPTPRYLKYLKNYVEGGIQPVDENIDPSIANILAEDTNTEIILYKEVSVWHPGDYVHIVLSRPQPEWTPESYKLQVRRRSKSKKLIEMILNNQLFSRRASRIAFVKRKLNKS